MGERIDGTLISAQVKEEVKQQVDELLEAGKRAPHLVVIQVGDDSRSDAYVRGKKNACQDAGITFTHEHVPEDYGEDKLIELIDKYNKDDEVDAMLVQLPLPAGYDEKHVTESIVPNKDVDGLTEANIIRLYNNEKGLVPATPLGIMKILEAIGQDVDGKHVVIIGRGKLVGHPLSLLMLNHNATVTVCHSHTKNLKEIAKTADILVVGIGKMYFIDSEYIKEGAIVIDAGINVNEEGKLKGDCNYEDMIDKASYMTPVPRGVGPMTVAMLLVNVMTAYHLNEE